MEKNCNVGILMLKSYILMTDISKTSFLNPFNSNVILMEKPGSWFALTKGVKSICGRVKLSVMIQVIELHLYLKSHTSNGAFYTLCLCNSVAWPGFSIKRTLTVNT